MLENGEATIRRYWAIDYEADADSRPEEEYACRLRELLIDAVRIRLRADVPVGAYLSGGLDSTLTTALIKGYTNAPLRTFSVSFEDSEFDESAYQREAAKYLGTDHEEVVCSSETIGRVFPDVIWHTEKPILRTAPAPLYCLSKLVRESGYKVVITGEGSDEMFGGYDIFKEAKIRRFWAAHPESHLRPLLLRKLYPYLPNIQSQPDAYRKAFFHIKPEDLASPLLLASAPLGADRADQTVLLRTSSKPGSVPTGTGSSPRGCRTGTRTGIRSARRSIWRRAGCSRDTSSRRREIAWAWRIRSKGGSRSSIIAWRSSRLIFLRI